MASPPFTFDALTHTYRDADGNAVPSVTQILQGVGASTFVPGDEEDYRYAADRGTAVHRFCELFDVNEEDWSQVEGTVLEPFCRAYARFVKETSFTPRLIEHAGIACVSGMRYGYTLDREGDLDGKPTIIDIKTGSIQRSWALQLAGYELALREHDFIRRQRKAVRLCNDGSYSLYSYGGPADEQIFRAALAIETWKRRTK